MRLLEEKRSQSVCATTALAHGPSITAGGAMGRLLSLSTVAQVYGMPACQGPF